MARKARTVLELCVVRAGGVHRGAFLCGYLIQWSMTADDLGHFPTIAEYGDWWALSPRGAELQSAKLRRAFTEEELRRLVDQIVVAGDARMSRRALQGLLVAV